MEVWKMRSECCRAPVTVSYLDEDNDWGVATMWHTCSECGAPCDVTKVEIKEEEK